MPGTRAPYPLEFRQQMVELVRTARAPEERSREFEPSARAIRNRAAQGDRELETVDTLLAFAREGDGATIPAYGNIRREVAQGAVVAGRIVEPRIGRRMCQASRAQATDTLVRETVSFIEQVIDENRAPARWRREPTV